MEGRLGKINRLDSANILKAEINHEQGGGRDGRREAPIKTCRDFNAVASSPNLIFPHETFMAACRTTSNAPSKILEETLAFSDRKGL